MSLIRDTNDILKILIAGTICLCLICVVGLTMIGVIIGKIPPDILTSIGAVAGIGGLVTAFYPYLKLVLQTNGQKSSEG